MQDNDVWDLVPLLEGAKPIGCKWIFKTKRDSKADLERYKACLVAYFDLELHQMDVKTMFLNGNIDEKIYMVHLENFVFKNPKKMVGKLNKFIYGLKQASLQWYYKFHPVIVSFGFEINMVDDCVYHKFSGSKHIFLVL